MFTAHGGGFHRELSDYLGLLNNHRFELLHHVVILVLFIEIDFCLELWPAQRIRNAYIPSSNPGGGPKDKIVFNISNELIAVTQK